MSKTALHRAVWPSSSRAYKEEIRAINNESDLLYDLRPVSFCYKDDPNRTHQYGLIAEEVVNIFPSLVIYHDDKIHSVKYDQLIPLLVNEISRLRARIEILEEKA